MPPFRPNVSRLGRPGVVAVVAVGVGEPPYPYPYPGETITLRGSKSASSELCDDATVIEYPESADGAGEGTTCVSCAAEESESEGAGDGDCEVAT